MEKSFGERTPWLLVSSPLATPEEFGFDLVHATEGAEFTDENFYLYRPTASRLP